MFCKNCGTELKEGAKFCPRCGSPAHIPQQKTAAQGTAAGGRRPVKQKGGKKKFLIPAVSVAAVLVVGIGVFAMARSNFFRSRFSSPEDYYKYVEQAYIDQHVKRFDDLADSASPNTTLTADITLEDAGLALLGINGYVSQSAVDDLNDLEIRIQTGEKGNLTGLDAGLYTSSGDALVTANAVVDSDSNEMYLQVPELSSGYLLLDSEALPGMDLGSLTGTGSGPANMENFSTIVTTYSDIMLDYMVDVDRERTDLSVGGVDQKAVLLTVTAKGDDLQDMVLDIMETMRTDENLEEYISYYANYMNLMNGYGYSPYSYETFIEELDRTTEYWKNNDVLTEMSAEMEVWVDSSGKIIGRGLSVSNGEERMDVFRYLFSQDGGMFAYELSFGDPQDEYGDYLLIEGDGMMRKNLASGTFTLESAGQTIGQIEVTDYDTKSAEDGLFNGTFKLTSDSDPSLAGYGLEIAVSSEKKSSTQKISLLSNDVPVATLNMETRTDSDYTPSLPQNAEIYNISDNYDMMEYEATMDLEGLEYTLRSNEFLALVLFGGSSYYY